MRAMRATGRKIRRQTQVALMALCLLLGAASAARADEYNPSRAGHPLRIAAYIVYPVGVLLDYLIFRPAHWLGSQPAVSPVFGHPTVRTQELLEEPED